MKCVRCNQKLSQLEFDFSQMLGVEICAKCANEQNNKGISLSKRLSNEIARADMYADDNDPKTISYFKGYSNGVKWAKDQMEAN